jgi:hypothetical protein
LQRLIDTLVGPLPGKIKNLALPFRFFFLGFDQSPHHRQHIFKVGFPCSLNERKICSLERAASLDNAVITIRAGQTMKNEFYVVIEKDEDGFCVGEVPALEGSYAQGRSIFDTSHMNPEPRLELGVHSNFRHCVMLDLTLRKLYFQFKIRSF